MVVIIVPAPLAPLVCVEMEVLEPQATKMHMYLIFHSSVMDCNDTAMAQLFMMICYVWHAMLYIISWTAHGPTHEPRHDRSWVSPWSTMIDHDMPHCATHGVMWTHGMFRDTNHGPVDCAVGHSTARAWSMA